jgi:aryl-alcohol dehydrogenase-like predicted oxidoreductase
MALNSYNTIGRSGLRVSPLCLGGMTLGDDWKWGADESISQKIIRRFIELGGNFIDTASIYTNGHSEKIIGDVVGKHPSLRTGMVIGTKFGGNPFPGNPNGGGSGARRSLKAVTCRLEGFKPTISTCYGFINGTGILRWKKRCGPWITWYLLVRSGILE